MDLFKPELSLIREQDGTYTLHSVTLMPTSCYRSAGIREGVPDGLVTIPESIPYQLRIAHVGDICLQVITPVLHQVPNITFGPGHDAVTAFAMLDGKVVGVSSIRRSAAQGAPLAMLHGRGARSALAESPVRCLSKARAGEIVIGSCPQPVTSMDQQLNEVGVTDPDTQLLFVENVRQRVVQAGCHIDTADIPNDPSNTVKEVRDAVSSAAH